MRSYIAVGLAAILATSCTSSSEEAGFGCQSAPEAQRHSESEFPLSVSENPVSAGEVVSLYVGSNETPGGDNIVGGEALTGYSSSWQCWNGTEWVSTHVLVHGRDEPGETMDRQPGVTVTQPAIGYPVPFPFEVTVPAVVTGWYRIQTAIIADLDDGSTGAFVGHVAVEVSGNG